MCVSLSEMGEFALELLAVDMPPLPVPLPSDTNAESVDTALHLRLTSP